MFTSPEVELQRLQVLHARQHLGPRHVVVFTIRSFGQGKGLTERGSAEKMDRTESIHLTSVADPDPDPYVFGPP